MCFYNSPGSFEFKITIFLIQPVSSRSIEYSRISAYFRVLDYSKNLIKYLNGKIRLFSSSFNKNHCSNSPETEKEN